MDAKIEKRLRNIGELIGRRQAILEELETVEKEIEYELAAAGGSKPLTAADKKKVSEPATGKHKCGNCGKEGHIRRTCPAAVNYHAANEKEKSTRPAKSCCGSTGSRHFNWCKENGTKEPTRSMQDVYTDQNEHASSPRVPLTQEQYDTLREAMHDREFMSAKYALINKLSPAEVNAAVLSVSYENYLITR